MAKYLDLTVFQEETFEVRLNKDEVLHIKKPSQRLVIDLMNYEKEFNNKKDPKKVVSSFVSLIVKILNNNTEGKVFNNEFVENQFSFEIGVLCIKSYVDFVSEVNSDPNL